MGCRRTNVEGGIVHSSMGSRALIVRDPGRLVDAHEGQGAYLRGIETVAGLPHYFQRGPELTRPNRAPLVWFPLQLHGTDAFAAELDRMLDLAVVRGIILEEPLMEPLSTLEHLGDELRGCIPSRRRSGGGDQPERQVDGIGVGEALVDRQ